MQKIIIFTQNHYGNHYQAYQMWYHLVGNFISFHMTPLLCRKNALFKHDSQITKYMFKMAAILEKAPSRNSSQDTACLPQIFLFPVKNWFRKTTWKFLLLQVAPPSVITWSINRNPGSAPVVTWSAGQLSLQSYLPLSLICKFKSHSW